MDDVTKSELEEKFEHAVEALRKSEERSAAARLALEVMHDIRNPLEAMRNLNYLISTAAGNSEEVDRYTRLADEQLDIAIEVANSTLSFARTSAGPRVTDIAAIVESALRIHQRTIDRKHLDVRKHFEADVVAAVFPGQLLQVIANLITNALDALPLGGTLCLRVRKCQRFIHLIVADNGHGIPADSLASIFVPFYTTKQERGTGLGLALSLNIIENHHGTIRVRSSVTPGKSGTCFVVCLPR